MKRNSVDISKEESLEERRFVQEIDTNSRLQTQQQVTAQNAGKYYCHCSKRDLCPCVSNVHLWFLIDVGDGRAYSAQAELIQMLQRQGFITAMTNEQRSTNTLLSQPTNQFHTVHSTSSQNSGTTFLGLHTSIGKVWIKSHHLWLIYVGDGIASSKQHELMQMLLRQGFITAITEDPQSTHSLLSQRLNQPQKLQKCSVIYRNLSNQPNGGDSPSIERLQQMIQFNGPVTASLTNVAQQGATTGRIGGNILPATSPRETSMSYSNSLLLSGGSRIDRHLQPPHGLRRDAAVSAVWKQPHPLRQQTEAEPVRLNQTYMTMELNQRQQHDINRLSRQQRPAQSSNPQWTTESAIARALNVNMQSPSSQASFSLPALLVRPSTDQGKLSEYQFLLRQQIEIFEANDDDVRTHVRGRNKQVMQGQVGLRCRHCAHLPVSIRQKGASYFPSNKLGIYQAAQNMSNSHFQHGLCATMPDRIKIQFSVVTNSRHSAANHGTGRSYWSRSASRMGLVDTEQHGIRFLPNLPTTQSFWMTILRTI
jgi:hypothetical protein